jgi:protein TonB
VKSPSLAIPSLTMTKALILSLAIHGAILAILLIYSTGKPAEEQKVITIFLSGDLQQSSAVAHGRADGTDIGAHQRHSQGGQRFEEYKTGVGPASRKPLVQTAREAVSVDEQPREKMISAAEAHDPPREAGAAARSLTIASSTAERSSEVDGKSDGGAKGVTGGDPSGTGDWTADGAGSRTGTGTGLGKATGDAQSGYMKEQFVYIRDLVLKKLTYPPLARERGWEGVVLLFFVIRENGTVEQIRVMKSSGHEVLDEQAMRTVRSVQPFPRPPVKAQLIIPIAFRLQ